MGLINGETPTWVITLKRSEARRTSLMSRLAPSGIKVNWFDAVDGGLLTDDQVRRLNKLRLRYYASGLTRGELGCYLSHRALLEQIAGMPQDATLVLEDDAELDPHFVEVVDALVALGGFDLISLDGHPKRRRYVDECTLPAGYARVRSYESKSGAVAYIVSREGARKLASYCDDVIHPIDVAIKRYWDYNGALFNIVPTIAREKPGTVSSIGELGRRTMTALTLRGCLYHYRAELSKGAFFLTAWLGRSLSRRIRAGAPARRQPGVA